MWSGLPCGAALVLMFCPSLRTRHRSGRRVAAGMLSGAAPVTCAWRRVNGAVIILGGISHGAVCAWGSRAMPARTEPDGQHGHGGVPGAHLPLPAGAPARHCNGSAPLRLVATFRDAASRPHAAALPHCSCSPAGGGMDSASVVSQPTGQARPCRCPCSTPLATACRTRRSHTPASRPRPQPTAPHRATASRSPSRTQASTPAAEKNQATASLHRRARAHLCALISAWPAAPGSALLCHASAWQPG